VGDQLARLWAFVQVHPVPFLIVFCLGLGAREVARWVRRHPHGGQRQETARPPTAMDIRLAGLDANSRQQAAILRARALEADTEARPPDVQRSADNLDAMIRDLNGPPATRGRSRPGDIADLRKSTGYLDDLIDPRPPTP